MPFYWHGQKSITLRAADGGKKMADILFAFGGRGSAEISVDAASRKVTLEYISGPFTGRQSFGVAGGNVWAEWEIEFRGIYRLFSGFNLKHFRSGTLHALERLSGKTAGEQRPRR